MRTFAFSITIVCFSLAAAWAQQSDQVIQKDDVLYGRVDGSALLADLTYPEGRRQMPAILIVHGGRWRAGAKSDANYRKGADWARAGFFAMNIDYRLVSSSPAPACYQDLYTALRWMHAHADEYGIDINRIYLIGNSSGGHEVALAATLGEGPYPRTGGWENAKSDFRAAISIAGAYDLTTLSWGNLWTPLAGDANTGFTTLSQDLLVKARQLASPLDHVGPATKPILIIHSDDDKSVPVEQAIDMVRTLERAKVRHKFIHYTDRGHLGFTDEAIREARSFITELESGR
jgi:acetyl esterase/lipase